MKQTMEALKAFFSSFGLPAYLSGNIPDNVKMPYITYDLVEPEPLSTATMNASVWYRSTGTTEVALKADEIKAAIGNGRDIQTESGVIHLFRDNGVPFCQIMNDPDRETKRGLLSLRIHCNTE